MDNSFIYMISSDDRTNTTLPVAGQNIFYDFNFGGFSEQYDDYICEVVSFALTGGITAASTYLILCAENLCENGYFCSKMLSRKECVLSVIPLNAVQDAYIQSDGGNISFRVNNCRVSKQITLFIVKPDFSAAVVGTEVNAGGIETKWILTLRMRPIEKGK